MSNWKIAKLLLIDAVFIGLYLLSAPSFWITKNVCDGEPLSCFGIFSVVLLILIIANNYLLLKWAHKKTLISLLCTKAGLYLFPIIFLVVFEASRGV